MEVEKSQEIDTIPLSHQGLITFINSISFSLTRLCDNDT
jgi:hypothetical protein